jgi:hypothetical protein
MPDSSSSDESTAAASARRPSVHYQKFSPEEDQRLQALVAQYETKSTKIARHMPNRWFGVCKKRWCNHLNPGLNLSLWTQGEEDLLLQKFKEFGPKWNQIVTFFPGRSSMHCKGKWHTLQKRISSTICKLNSSPWTQEEDALLLQKYQKFGPKWTKIAAFFPNRSLVAVITDGSIYSKGAL